MPSERRNYLLGFGENLTVPVRISSGGRPKSPPYSLAEARARIVPMAVKTAQSLDALPAIACPRGEAVASLTLHPEYFAKSYFPAAVLREARLRAIGSRARRVRPEKRSRGREPEEAATTELFIAGMRSSFQGFAGQIAQWQEDSPEAKQLPSIEQVSTVDSESRLRKLTRGEENLPLEAVLHASDAEDDQYILAGFQRFLEEIEVRPDLERIFFAGRLCFLRLRASADKAHEIARFSFLRVLREMPRLRAIHPVLRGNVPGPRFCELPDQAVIDANVRVAILDGGLSNSSPLTAWTNALDASGVGEAHPDLLWHGETVTSALLFGNVDGGSAQQPFCRADHFRVLAT